MTMTDPLKSVGPGSTGSGPHQDLPRASASPLARRGVEGSMLESECYKDRAETRNAAPHAPRTSEVALCCPTSGGTASITSTEGNRGKSTVGEQVARALKHLAPSDVEAAYEQHHRDWTADKQKRATWRANLHAAGPLLALGAYIGAIMGVASAAAATWGLALVIPAAIVLFAWTFQRLQVHARARDAAYHQHRVGKHELQRYFSKHESAEIVHALCRMGYLRHVPWYGNVPGYGSRRVEKDPALLRGDLAQLKELAPNVAAKLADNEKLDAVVGTLRAALRQGVIAGAAHETRLAIAIASAADGQAAPGSGHEKETALVHEAVRTIAKHGLEDPQAAARATDQVIGQVWACQEQIQKLAELVGGSEGRRLPKHDDARLTDFQRQVVDRLRSGEPRTKRRAAAKRTVPVSVEVSDSAHRRLASALIQKMVGGTVRGPERVFRWDELVPSLLGYARADIPRAPSFEYCTEQGKMVRATCELEPATAPAAPRASTAEAATGATPPPPAADRNTSARATSRHASPPSPFRSPSGSYLTNLPDVSHTQSDGLLVD